MRRTLPVLAGSVLTFGSLLALSPQNPGVVFEMTTVDHTRGGETDVGLLQVSGPDVAMAVTTGEGRGRMIFRGEAREMIVVDDSDRSYMTLDEARLAALAEQMNAAMAQMEQMLASLPPEQRAMIERMQEQGMSGMPGMENMPSMTPPAEVEVRATGRSETRAGYPTEEYEILEDGVVARRLWVAPWSEVEGAEEARDAMMGMVRFFDDFLAAMPRMPGQDGAMIRNPFRHMDMESGVPVVSQELSPEGQVERETTITSVERRVLESATFQPPEGYTRRSLPGG